MVWQEDGELVIVSLLEIFVERWAVDRCMLGSSKFVHGLTDKRSYFRGLPGSWSDELVRKCSDYRGGQASK